MSSDPLRCFAALDPLLRCPQCLGSAALHVGAQGWSCAGCGAVLPLIGGLPWLFAEAGARLAEWRQRFKLRERELEASRSSLRAALGTADLIPATRTRLELLDAGLAAQIDELRALLAPLRLDESIARHETLLALRTRTPLSQDLNSYYVNVHRDWVWGGAENEAALELVRDLARGETFGRLLVPGAGAGRLAWDVHESLGPQLTLGLDINPLLTTIAAQVSAGGKVRLHEFPTAPRTAAEIALPRVLQAPRPARAGLLFALGDALRSPFRAASFDTLLTPWFIDIVPHDFAAICRQFSGLLRLGGRWLNFGSLSFAHRDAVACHGPDEIRTLLEANGFELQQVIERDLPYLRSPASRHGRIETVHAFAAIKRHDSGPSVELANLPEWLADSAVAVPLLPYFQGQALANRIFAFVMALIDGQRSINRIAAYLVEQKLLLPEEAEAAVRSFLVALYEESRRRDQY